VCDYDLGLALAVTWHYLLLLGNIAWQRYLDPFRNSTSPSTCPSPRWKASPFKMALTPLSSPPLSLSNPLERKKTPASPVSPTRNPKPPPKAESTKQPAPARLPPPSLFQGPPSRNASNISLHLPGASAAAIALPASAAASTSVISPSTSADHLQRISSRRSAKLKENQPGEFSPSGADAVPRAREAHPVTATDVNTKRENDRASALWAEMQNTLAEVELSAANESYIFGAGHATALEELRTAQLALAKAWARSEQDEVGSYVAREDTGDDVTVPRNAPKQGQPQQASSAAKKGSEKEERKKTLEEETEHDILLAKTRREANDRYFEQVNNSVLDAVAKLDQVAAAMRKVEKESRDIWSEVVDGDGTGSGSVSGTGSGTVTGNGSGRESGAASTTGGEDESKGAEEKR